MAGSIIKNIKTTKCGWDGKLLGKGTSTTRGHSHKDLMKCLYKSNVEIFRAQQAMQSQSEEIKKLQQELAGFVIKEQQEKEETGIMDVKEPVEVVDDPTTGGGGGNGKKEAKVLLEDEKNGRDTK